MSAIAITVIGTDRPSIVAAITRGLFDVGCNLEDVSSTILRGHFSMTMIAHCPDDIDPGAIEDRLSAVATELGVVVAARPVEDTDSYVAPPTHMISVYGSDKPGIVFRVADALAQRGLNITDLNSRLIGGDADPVYVLQVEVHAPGDVVDLEGILTPLREELGVDLSVRAIQADVL